jgi:hypothetical protein
MRRALLLGGAVLAATLLALVLGWVSGRGAATVARAAGGTQAPTAGDSFEPVLGLPAAGGNGVVVIGASPRENPGEVWAYGTIGAVPAFVNGSSYSNQGALLEHTEASGWQVVPLPASQKGEPLSPSTSAQTFPAKLGPFGGRTTAAGGVVLLTDGGIVSRDPHSQPQIVPAPEKELLGSEESLPPESPSEQAPTPYTAIEESSAGGVEHTGLLIAPYHDGADVSLGTRVLHYDGEKWTSERLTGPGGVALAGTERKTEVESKAGEGTTTKGKTTGSKSEEEGKTGEAQTQESKTGESKTEFSPEALACGGTSTTETAASSPTNCWLLAAYKSEASASAANRLALFRRVASTSGPVTYTWQQQPIEGGLLGEESVATSATALGQGAQMLTATSQGVWLDYQAKVAGASKSTDVSTWLTPAREGLTQTEKWCSETSSTTCPQSLGASLPATYESFAWAGSGTEPGTRIITGLPRGALLELAGDSFSQEVGAGGGVNGSGGAAFDSSEEGWMGNGEGTSTPDLEGQSQMIEITPRPQGDQLAEAPVPFRYPLLAVAQAPGTTTGEPGAQAIAVGMKGEIGRYTPAQGWQPESLYNSAGVAQTPVLRGVAWPEPGRAYAVGDGGAMWLWQASTGLWVPDPAKPLNFIGDLTAIAFSPSHSALGYAVGKAGTLLRFGKSWEQVPLPADLQQVNFTSITFAGGEALATYRSVNTAADEGNGAIETGGVAVEETGTGEDWHVDPAAASLFAQLPAKATVLSKVAGLPDGGAVAAGPGVVIERESSGAAWQFSSQPLPEAENVSALGAYQDAAGAVRAVVSVDLDPYLDPNAFPLQFGAWSGDVPPPSGSGQPPFLPPPDPLPSTGYLLRQTASGWEDMEHMALEAPTVESLGTGDMPVRPDPALALLVDPSGEAGLVVGGQTYDSQGGNNGSTVTGPEAGFETAAVMRFGAGASSADAEAPVTTVSGRAAFAVGGNAACATSCADLASESIGPDVSLSHALASAAQIASSSSGGLRGFLYTGGRLAAGMSAEAFEGELNRYASLLGAAGSLQVHVAASPTDRDPEKGGIEPFTAALGPFLGGKSYYAFTSSGSSGGPVRVIVLDYSTGELGGAQERWLREELALAKNEQVPAIVMGNASLGFKLPDGSAPAEARDAAAVSAILGEGQASAYLFDYPNANVQTVVSGSAIPAFGTGTLGYTARTERYETDNLGSSGFLLLEVETAARNPATNVAPVSARVVPNIGQLALEAAGGVFLRRSQVALFEALARRPAQGLAVSLEASGAVRLDGAEPYDPIPFNCLGANCAYEVTTEYTFSSSNPDVGNFVAHEAGSANPDQVQLGANQLPVADPHSGLFCAFNSGTTTVSITTGGLTYSEPVTVQAGSVEYPCGTVPLTNPPPAEVEPKAQTAPLEVPPAGPVPTASPQIHTLVPPPAPAPAVVVHHPPPPRVAAPVFFLPLSPSPPVLRPAIVPPPAPPAGEPTPPTGASQVMQTAVQKEKEEETAVELTSTRSAAAAYDPNQSSGPGPWILLLVLVAAGAGTGVRRGRRYNRADTRARLAFAFSTQRRRRPPWR